jgi:hypothetical protein
MSGDDRLNRNQKSTSSQIGVTIILLALFAAAGIAVTLMFSYFEASMPSQLLSP